MRAPLSPRSIGARLLLATLTAVASTAAAQAAEPACLPADDDPGDIEDYSLEDLLRKAVTSATGGVEVESDAAPANVTTISRDDIIALGWQSIAQVLEHVAGLYVIDDQVLPAVAVRGISGGLRSGSRIVKVMINGTEVTFRPDLTAMLGREYLPIIAVERIEIARGPLSALYGANAFLATVNVVTRTASQARSEVALSTERHEGDGASGMGAGGSALLSTGAGPHGLVLAARFDRLDRSGLTIPRTFASQATTDQQVFDRPSDFDLSRPFSLFGQATSQGGWGELALQGGFQRLDAYGEFQPDSALTHRSRHGLQNTWAALSHTRAWTPWLTSTVTLGSSRGSPTDVESLVLGGNRNSIYQPQLSYQAFDSKLTLLFRASEKLQALLALEATHEEHQGFTYRQTFVRPEAPHVVGDQIDARPPIAVTLSNFAPALQVLSEPLPDLHLFANARLDLSDVFAAQTSWRIGTAYRLHSALVAKLIAGRAFQSPSPVLLYGLPGFGVSGTIIGSNTLGEEPLEPQIVQSAELVLSALPSTHVSVVASIYWQTVDEKIEFLSNAVGYRARNRRREMDLGGELSLRASYGRFTSHLTATAHHVVSTDEPPSSIGEAPAHFPTYWSLADLRMAVPEARLHLGLIVRRVGPRGASQGNAFLNGEPYALAAYTRGDVTVTSDELELLGEKRATRATLGIRNLLDERHAEPGFGGFDIPSAGRTVFLELRRIILAGASRAEGGPGKPKDREETMARAGEVGDRVGERAFRGVVAALGVVFLVLVTGLVGGCKGQELASCVDGARNGNETDVDCGGGCIPCDLGAKCATARDCLSLLCVSAACVMPEAPSCTDGVKNGVETDVDCGGGCAACTDGKLCSSFSDCASVVCSQARCQPPSCTDGANNSLETDIDCGGGCGGCRAGRLCQIAGDCASSNCSPQDRRCVAETCTDALKNGAESDVDCGGSCSPCPTGKTCVGAPDCQQGVCGGDRLCAAATCSDNVRNGLESDVDCGSGCATCVAGRSCNRGNECGSGVCAGGLCAQAACNDGVKNAAESDVDCGGSCPACLGGRACGGSADCDSLICNNRICAAATCSDGVKNGAEGDVDCGGASCARCSDGLTCRGDGDCSGGQCGAANRCSALTAPLVDPKTAVSPRPSVRDSQGTVHTLVADGDRFVHIRQTPVGGGQATAVTAKPGEYLFHRLFNRPGAANYRVVINSTGTIFLFFTTTRGPVVSDRDKDVPYLATYSGQGGWTAPVDLRARGLWPDFASEYHTGMDVVVDANDNLHLAVAFSRYSGSDFLEYFQLSPDASTQVKRTRLHNAAASRPTLLADQDGALHLAYDENVAARPIWYQSSTDAGTTWSAAVAVANGTGSTDPTIGLAVTGSGAGRARWLSHRGAENQLHVLRSTDGVSFAPVYASSEAGLDHGGSRLLPLGANLHVFFAGPTAAGGRPRLRRVVLDGAGAPGAISTLEPLSGTYGTFSFGLLGATFPSFTRPTLPTATRHWIASGATATEFVLSTEIP